MIKLTGYVKQIDSISIIFILLYYDRDNERTTYTKYVCKLRDFRCFPGELLDGSYLPIMPLFLLPNITNITIV